MRRIANPLLMVLLVAGGLSLWLGRSESPDRPPPAPQAASVPEAWLPPSAQVPKDSDEGQDGPARTAVHLAVLNGTPQPRLAQQVSLAVASIGCVAERVGNAPHDRFERSLLVNRRLDPAAAADLAARLGGLQVILEKDPRFSEDAVLVLGADCERVLQSLGAELTR
jgi:hypothetical protein